MDVASGEIVCSVTVSALLLWVPLTEYLSLVLLGELNVILRFCLACAMLCIMQEITLGTFVMFPNRKV